MVNRHFGKAADVWKHLALAELLAAERPTVYGETHAGSGGYVPVNDPEPRFGVLRFLAVAYGVPVLAGSRYRAQLRRLLPTGTRRAHRTQTSM